MRRTFIPLALSAIVLLIAGCESWDMPAYKEPVLLGSDGSSGRIAVVYHPGATEFTQTMVMRLGNELASRGYIAAVFTANPGLSLDQSDYDALVIGSPVYGAEIRPPVKDFIITNAPFSMPVFALLTGGFGTAWYESNDLPALVSFLDQANVSLTACVKIAVGTFDADIDARIDYLTDAIDGALGND